MLTIRFAAHHPIRRPKNRAGNFALSPLCHRIQLRPRNPKNPSIATEPQKTGIIFKDMIDQILQQSMRRGKRKEPPPSFPRNIPRRRRKKSLTFFRTIENFTPSGTWNKPIQSIMRRHPQNALRILMQRDHKIIRQTLACRELFELAIAPMK
jgi:hypothetical protein